MDTTEERLAACALVRTRFQGRATLEREAQRNDVALAELECRLGLATDEDVIAARRASVTRELLRIAGQYSREYGCGADGCGPRCRHGRAVGYLLASHEARERQATIDYASAARDDDARQLARLVAPEACAAIARLREDRAARRPAPAPPPGRILRRCARREWQQQCERARFRRATHEHRDAFRYVDVGREGASSESGQSWAAASAHARYRYPNATSAHTYAVSAAIVQPEVRALNADVPTGVLYLAVDVRVRQGRGTSLVTERRRGARGGWELAS
ncbi:MAG: hypothetical protein FWD17_15185 [Polyangiaceae bacterium]|nr:hypothetical protein [Polyangiaceae bacterium]